ncbi:MAG: shikimate dehydrogenase [Clostridiaceae bacterium]|uniref:Multifunctional fusion protein n=1 Tax=Clostridium porci TaxID=2605778 RepID=A0A7X2TBI6_9CLOT|nr:MULTISPECIES: shikimate dehydrogenase [Clostridium]MCI6140770.1 shikimate dehydrogenase [Clostridium sp.]MDY3231297.1 shikimate dehydrogenase [Clostridiaceae bacterium]MSS35138.1 shikimate dehydrogenase [Clostridium porci]
MDGKTKVCGLIANPVEHSMSPLMHNFYARRTGINLAYVPFKVEKDQVEAAVKGAFALNILGMNVTVPYKQQVMEYLDELDDAAYAIGAVNTLVRTEHGFKGYNTDGAGFERALREAGIKAAGEACILLGAGGAAKAVAYVLAREGAKLIYILNRKVERARELAEYINEMFGRRVMYPLSLDAYPSIPYRKGGYLAIQSTSVGMAPKEEDVIIEDKHFYEMLHTGVDIVYTPAKTRFMKLVESAGGRAVNGLDMLLYQGIIAYELWNPQINVDKETIEAARALLQERLSGNTALYKAAVEESEGRKRNLIFIGFMGAGKTSVGKAYAKAFHMPWIDTDQRIEAAAGMAVSQIFAAQGEEAFRRLETSVLEELLASTDGSVISVGGGLPLRAENRTLLKKLGTVVYLDASPATVLERIGRDVSDRPMLQGEDVMERITGLLACRRPVYLEASHVILDVNGRSVEELVKEIYSRVKN